MKTTKNGRIRRITGLLIIGAVLICGLGLYPQNKVIAAESSLPGAFRALPEDLLQLPVTRDQDPDKLGWNTCWAFAATALAELDATSNHGASTNINLSEMGLAYYTYNSNSDPIGISTGDVTIFKSEKKNFLTYGGSVDFALETMASGNGLMNESALPYSRDVFDRILQYGVGDSYTNEYRLDAAYCFKLTSDSSMMAKRFIKERGAIATSVYAGSSLDENGKVYYDDTNNSYYYKKGVVDYPENNEPYANHAMVIVGWNDDFPSDAFSNKAPGNGAWLVRNSWSNGEQSAFDGYFWLSYYDDSLGQNAYAVKLGGVKDYDNRYQYDCGILTNDTLLGVDTSKSVNVFRTSVSQKELLSAVAIHPNKPCDYTIRIYKGMENSSKPTGGTLVHEQTGSTDCAGFMTIPLSKQIELLAGEYFSVEAELSGAKMTCEYGSSSIYIDESQGRFGTRCGLKKGQSYILNDGKYVDIVETVNAAGRNISSLENGLGYGNVRIKAYTQNAAEAAKPLKVKGFKAKRYGDVVDMQWETVAKSAADGYYIYKQNKKGSYNMIKKINDPTVSSYTYKNTSKYVSNNYAIKSYKASGDIIEKSKVSKITFK
ncbi:MAG: hypothetical protein K6F00_09945 [Lachnospiraceae bacterium]|nr:hypothetical protein [Lachnospiraceae bacterium]